MIVFGTRHSWLVWIPAATLAATLASGCNSGSPTAPAPVAAPPPAAPTVSALSITGLDALRTGFFTEYTASATLSNGTTQTVTPTWSVSNSSLASVDANGRLNGHAHGHVVLSATHQGASASKTVAIVTNFGGQWSGRYVMRACDQSGAFAAIRYCQGLGGAGATGPLTLSLTQSGNDRSQVSGTISFGGVLTGTVSGAVTSDARLVIGGSFTVTSSGVTFSFRVGGWETRMAGTSNMTGRWADNLTAIGVAGNAYTENELISMTRSSVAEVPTSAPQHLRLDWSQLFSSMRSPE